MDISIPENKKAKYYPTLHELSTPYKSALDIVSNIEFILKYGLERLDFGMHSWAEVDKLPSFDPDDPYQPYDTKNLYFTATNAIYMCKTREKCPWTILPYCISELYFQKMLDRVKEYERSYEKRTKTRYNFNKGLAYANLGIAQAAQMKLDEGFANILKALDEDRGYARETPKLFDSYLFTQFERIYVKKPLRDLISKLKVIEDSRLENYVDSFLKSLSDNLRMFFDYTLIRIIQTYDIWKEKDNSFSANRLLAYTQDFCLFNEAFLKSKLSEEVRKSNIWVLKDLLIEFKLLKKSQVKGCGAKEMDVLDKKLSSELSKKDVKIRCLRILLTLRNYSSHNIGGGTKKNFFYSQYDKILLELMRAMYYIIET